MSFFFRNRHISIRFIFYLFGIFLIISITFFTLAFYSIRANQHTETIQAQYEVLKQQKDELSARLSEAEDRESKNMAALTNLQCVLEQFQKGSCQKLMK